VLHAGSGAPEVVGPACIPLYATRFGEGFGTLYAAEYRPTGGRSYHWPGRTWDHSPERLGSRRAEIRLGTG